MMDKMSASSVTSPSIFSTSLKQKEGEEINQSTFIEQPENPTLNVESKHRLNEVVDSMNQFLKASRTHLKFEFHDELKKYYVSIVDDATQEVIKEIPPKKLLDMYASMTEFLGILVDKKV